MMRRILFIINLATGLGLAGISEAASVVSLKSLLEEMTDFGAVSRWPDPEFTSYQASSYDRATVAPDQPGWFANDDHSQFIRIEETEGRTEKVMMEADGPGAIVRFWLTTIKNKKGTLRIYLDGASEPALSFPAYDLLAGDLKIDPPLAQPHPGYSPTENGGNTLRLPIPFSSYCKITWEEDGEGPRYYQINWRGYAKGTTVETFSHESLDAARPEIERVNKMLLSPPDSPEGDVISISKKLPAGKQAETELPTGPSAIRKLEFKLTTADPAELDQALRATIFELTFDGEETVWCPASDLFGSGAGINPLESWYRTIRSDGTMTCRWIMPYQKSARMVISNIGKSDAEFSLRAVVDRWQWDERSMHFHTAWNSESDLSTTPPRDWNYINITGRGVYVGDTLSLFNPIATWYGEGDEKIRVDSEKLPSHLGTGTEDYYDYSFAPRGIMQTPFSNQTRVDQEMTQGHNVLTRTRNLDGMPFRKSLDFDIELISWKPTKLLYSATTHWYAFPGGKSNRKPLPEEALRHIPTLEEAQAAGRIPGAIECESAKVIATSPGLFVEPQEMGAFGSERWSGGTQLLAKAEAIGDFIEIEFTFPDDKPRELTLHATQAPDFGILQFTVNNQSVKKKFDGYASDVRPGKPFPLGKVTPKEGRITLRAKVTDTNSKSTGDRYYLGLDCVVAEIP